MPSAAIRGSLKPLTCWFVAAVGLEGGRSRTLLGVEGRIVCDLGGTRPLTGGVRCPFCGGLPGGTGLLGPLKKGSDCGFFRFITTGAPGGRLAGPPGGRDLGSYCAQVDIMHTQRGHWYFSYVEYR